MKKRIFGLLLAIALAIPVLFPAVISWAQFASGSAQVLGTYFVPANETAIQQASSYICSGGNGTNGGKIYIIGGQASLTKPLQACSGINYDGPQIWAKIPSIQTTCPGGLCFVATPSTISSGTYNSGTGVVVLTLSAAPSFAAGNGIALYGLTGTGAFNTLNSSVYCRRFGQDACNWTATSVVGSVVTFQGPTGLGASTITGGSLTFDGLDYNNADLAAPLADTATFLAGQMLGFSFRNASFVGFATAIKIGGLYNPGCGPGCAISNVNVIANNAWGLWIENYNNSTFDYVQGTNNTIGGCARVGSGTNLYNGGNSRWNHTECAPPTGTLGLGGRGQVTWLRGAGSNTTQDTYYAEAPNGDTHAATTAAATMSNASCDITVADATLFPMDMPMGWSAAVNGFNAIAAGGNNTTYFVVLNDGATKFRVSATMRGSCITPSGNTAVNALTKGYPIMEVAALTASAGFIGVRAYAVDVEGTATAQVVSQNIISNYRFEFSVIGGDTYNSIVRRTVTRGSVEAMGTVTVDSDINSGANLDFLYDGTNGSFGLMAGNGGGFKASTLGWLQYGTPYAGRWNFGDGQGNAFSSALDTWSLSKQSQGYITVGSNTNGNVAINYSQGSANGGSNNGQGSVQCGLVGTATDGDYHFNASGTGLLKGDFLCQTYTGSAFAPIWWTPGGGNNLAFGGALVSGGSHPVGTTGTCSASSFTGGSLAGKFTAPVCAGGTIILSSLPAAPNGYTCNAQDQTTSADTLKQTANTTTSATFLATTANNDVVAFHCTGW